MVSSLPGCGPWCSDNRPQAGEGAAVTCPGPEVHLSLADSFPQGRKALLGEPGHQPPVALENRGLKKHLPSLNDIHNVPPLCQHDKLGDRFKNVLTL